MATVNPYTDILSAAYRNLGQVNAEADYQQTQGQQNLSRLLDIQNQNRKKSVTGSRQNVSSRGLLDSSIALNQEADVNQGYDQQNGMYTRTYDDLLHQLSSKRLAAQMGYDDAQIQFQKWVDTGSLTPDTPGTPQFETVPEPVPPPAPTAPVSEGTFDPGGQVTTPSTPAPASTGYLGYTDEQWAAFMAAQNPQPMSFGAVKPKATPKPKAPVKLTGKVKAGF